MKMKFNVHGLRNKKGRNKHLMLSINYTGPNDLQQIKEGINLKGFFFRVNCSKRRPMKTLKRLNFFLFLFLANV